MTFWSFIVASSMHSIKCIAMSLCNFPRTKESLRNTFNLYTCIVLIIIYTGALVLDNNYSKNDIVQCDSYNLGDI